MVQAETSQKHPTWRADVSFLIIGGTGGIGQSLTRWMALEGARSIMLASRSGQSADGIQTLMQNMQSNSTSVIVQECNVGSESDFKRLISCPSSHGLSPIAGVIHGAIVLQSGRSLVHLTLTIAQDVLFEKFTIEDHLKVSEPRLQGARDLHNVMLASKIELNFFMVLSSTSGILGNLGQSAYAASNSFLDAFAQFRHGMQLPTSSIDLGLVNEVGCVFRIMPNKTCRDVIIHNSIEERELRAQVKHYCGQESEV